MSLNNFTVPNFTPIKQKKKKKKKKNRKWDKFINALNKSMPFTVPIFVELKSFLNILLQKNAKITFHENPTIPSNHNNRSHTHTHTGSLKQGVHFYFITIAEM